VKPVTFSPEETKAVVRDIQVYFEAELEQQIGAIPAEMLMKFFTDKMGMYFYNRGLYDAQALVRYRMEVLVDDMFALEQPTRHLR